MNKKRSFFIIMLLILLLFVSVCSGILFGSVNLSFSDIWAVLTAKDTSSTACVLLKTVRIPRVFGGLFAGVGLACAGVILQGVMNNSLASPNTIGVNSGSGFAVMLAMIFFPANSVSTTGLCVPVAHCSLHLLIFFLACALRQLPHHDHSCRYHRLNFFKRRRSTR